MNGNTIHNRNHSLLGVAMAATHINMNVWQYETSADIMIDRYL